MTKNEEANIEQCLRSVNAFDEVFVVDSRSTDGTRGIAEAHGARVIEFVWDGAYPKKKQWCLNELPFGHDWVLYIDADERVSLDLEHEISELIERGPDHRAYFLTLDYVFLRRRLRYGHRVLKLALLDRRYAAFPEYPDLAARNMWEVEGHYQPAVDGTAGVLRQHLLHEDQEPLYGWFARHNRYSEWAAVMAEHPSPEAGVEAPLPARRMLKAVFRRFPGRPFALFVYAYILRFGFLDGRAGLHYAIANAFYYWQINAKRYEVKVERSAAVGPSGRG